MLIKYAVKTLPKETLGLNGFIGKSLEIFKKILTAFSVLQK